MNSTVLWVGLGVVLPLLLLLGSSLGRDPHTVRSPLVGRAAPDFALTPLDGGAPIRLSDLRGRPAVLNFWATWCVPCFQEHEVLVRAARAHEGRVRFLGVVYEDDPHSVRRFLEREGSAYPSLMDGESKTAIAYGVFGVPESFFLDAQGQVVAKHTGPLDDQTLAEKLAQAGASAR